MFRSQFNFGSCAQVVAFTLAFALGCASLSAQPLTIFVDQATGDDLRAGDSPATAVATIRRGLQLTPAGGTLMIGPGLYTPTSGEIMPLSHSGNLTIIGSGSATTIIDAETQTAAMSIGGDILRFEGFTVQNGNAAIGAGIMIGEPLTLDFVDVHVLDCAGAIGGGIEVQMNSRCASTTLIDCVIAGNTASIGAGFHYQINPICDTDLTFIRTVFSGNVASIGGAVQFQENEQGTHVMVAESCVFDSNFGAGAGGVHFQRNAGTAFGTFTNCIFINNDSALVANTTDIVVVNCTFAGNQTAFTTSSPTGGRIANSIFWGNGNELSGGGIPISYSVLEGLTYGAFIDAGNNLDLDPLLTIDGRIDPLSPAIDRGDESAAATLALLEDIDGDDRVIDDWAVVDGPGGAIDIGADEIVVGPPPPNCSTICGDCDENLAGPDVLDALAAARIAAGLALPTGLQPFCCDVDASSTITIIDALLIAQTGVGLPVTLICL